MTRRRLKRLRSLSLREWLLLPQLFVLSLAIHVALLGVPLERVAALLVAGASTRGLRRLPLLHLYCDPDRLAHVADLATRLSSGRHRCLPRSLVLLWLMRARRQQVELLVGAARGTAGELEGHAWVEIEGRCVLDSPALTSRFSPFLKFQDS
jgi:hypothetical protein